jgi:hypothetical protein
MWVTITRTIGSPFSGPAKALRQASVVAGPCMPVSTSVQPPSSFRPQTLMKASEPPSGIRIQTTPGAISTPPPIFGPSANG